MGSFPSQYTLDSTFRDAEQTQQGLKTEVLGSLPVVKPASR